MEKPDLDILEKFLEQYKILYKNQFMINKARVEQLVSQFPDIELKSSFNKNDMYLSDSQKSKYKNPNSLLWRFEKKIKNCKECPLGDSRNKFVFGDGNEHADIFFIGEAPGADEDRIGIPFVGRAGKLLDRLLAEVKIRREDVFIGNILKCRPPQNRDPLLQEINTCTPYLNEQIKLIQPKIIVALGRIAAQYLLNSTSSLKQLRGRLWQYQGVDLIVTYHPAAILRTAGWLAATKEDFRYIASIYQKKITYKT
jgi:DNA polymerase